MPHYTAYDFATDKTGDLRPTEEEIKHSDVIYSLERIADVLLNSSPHLESDTKPSVLVMAKGKLARRLSDSIAELGLLPVLPVTDDGKLAFNDPGNGTTASLGAVYSEPLFSNAYAVLTLAQSMATSVILLTDGACDLAKVNSFLYHAKQAGIHVFTQVRSATFNLGWRLCEPADQVRSEPQWRTCHHCHLTFDEASFAKQNYTCPSCGVLMRMNSEQRINSLLDLGSFEEWFKDLEQTDPLAFAGYREKMDTITKTRGLSEAVRVGKGSIAGLPVAIGFMDTEFLMGSMGSVVGDKIARLFDRATNQNLSVVILCASGGARMQEGLISLMQMAKVACAVQRHSDAGLLYVSVITDPTTGGVTASFAMEADIILAEPGALVGFAGKRVIRDTIRQELPDGFQTAEFALEHGLIDAVVERAKLRETLAQLIALHLSPSYDDTHTIVVDYQSVLDHLNQQTSTYNSVHYGPAVLSKLPDSTPLTLFQKLTQRLFAPNDSATSESLERQLRRAATRERMIEWEGQPREGEFADDALVDTSAWESVLIARNVHRPTSQAYLRRLAQGFIELHGDRAFADDGAIVGGIGWFDDIPVTFITQEKGADVKERVRRNFGSPEPEGYRKSIRLMKQAEKFGRPILCLVDTQGAFCGIEAEERGQGNAIAESLTTMASLTVPVIAVFIGEGGSGGALALAVANRVAMLEHATYSILSPEGFASILWKDRSRAPEAAAVMKLSAADAFHLGVVDAVLSEGEGPAHENPDQAIEVVYEYVKNTLAELSHLTPQELVVQRQLRFGAF